MEKEMTVKELLKDARNQCPGLAEPVYKLAEYVSDKMGSPDFVLDFVTILLEVLSDLHDNEKNLCSDTPDYFFEHKIETLTQAKFILQIVDLSSNEEFVQDAREMCHECFGWDVPKMARLDNMPTKLDGYSDQINAAVNWWRKNLIQPKMDNGDDAMNIFMSLFGSALTRGNTQEKIESFCEGMAEYIKKKFQEGQDTVTFYVDYHPTRELTDIMKARQVELSLPIKTCMWVKKDISVTAYCGYGAPTETIWEKKAKPTKQTHKKKQVKVQA
jgi:hypothetical protein